MAAFYMYFVFFASIVLCNGFAFRNGRYRGGFLQPPRHEHKGSLPPDQWFQQQLDHFNPQETRTWQQRYFTNGTFYKPGGPIFLQIGGEGTADPIWMVTGAWTTYAQEYNALMFQVEHRYYGKSHPVSDLSTPNMKYLTSEQALEDLANFITTTSAKMNLTGSKWITFGGSYPGSLATWMRMKYPHLIHAAVASSAPLVAVADFSDYLRVVKESLDTTGPMCVPSIQKATDALTNLLDTDTGRQQLKSTFKLCDDIDPRNKNDIANLVSSLAGNFEGVVQYNRDNRAFEGGVGANITVDTLCAFMNDSSKTPLENYARVSSFMLETYSQKCLDYKFSNVIDDLSNTSWAGSAAEGGRQWTYQTCTEFGYYQTSAYDQQPFGDFFPLLFWTQQCYEAFGLSIDDNVLNNGIRFTNANYGGLGVKVSRIIWPNGSIDPWHALSITKDISEDATAIFINGTAHCANMYPESDDDLPALKQARLVIREKIGLWLNQ
ncbi:putative serine protease K12H4.7 [Watersipora subatra]|uniref:putative serine protease K12H4.7 n=1 Tax=Watersipora subatra TaxID=2589382 RepID=UPI00355BFBCA